MGTINRDKNDAGIGSSSDPSASATLGVVDWSTLLIEQELTDDYTVHVQEDTMYNLLGLKEEDETVLRQASNDANAALVDANISVIDANDTDGAALPVDDHGHRKLRIKGALEGGSGTKPKVGGQNKCKKCHELGHREAGCPYNGSKKRNSRRNEAPWEDGSTSTNVEMKSPTAMPPISPAKTPRNVSPCSPRPMKRSHTTVSPGPVTRSQTAVSPGPVTRSQAAMSPSKTPLKSTAKPMKIPPKKLTPKRRKLNL